VLQPEDVLLADIDANLRAPWIPASDIQAFAGDLFRVSRMRQRILVLGGSGGNRRLGQSSRKGWEVLGNWVGALMPFLGSARIRCAPFRLL
jgi:hypothetical protein